MPVNRSLIQLTSVSLGGFFALYLRQSESGRTIWLLLGLHVHGVTEGKAVELGSELLLQGEKAHGVPSACKCFGSASAHNVSSTCSIFHVEN